MNNSITAWCLLILLIIPRQTYATEQECNSCLKTKIHLEQDSVGLENFDYWISFEIESCGEDEIRLPFPKIGFEDDDINFANIVFKAYLVTKDQKRRVNLEVQDVSYQFDIESKLIRIAPKSKYETKCMFFNYCPIRERGKYQIIGLLRIKTAYGFFSVPTEPIELYIH